MLAEVGRAEGAILPPVPFVLLSGQLGSRDEEGLINLRYLRGDRIFLLDHNKQNNTMNNHTGRQSYSECCDTWHQGSGKFICCDTMQIVLSYFLLASC